MTGIGIIILWIHNTYALTEEQLAAQICKNRLVTSATQTPFGVICMIPKPSDTSQMENRQQFVRSLPKLLKSEQTGN